MRKVLGVLVALPALLLLLLVAQALTAIRREYPFEAFERIHATIRVGEGPPLRLAMLGDSTVAGVGSPSTELSLPVLTAERVAEGLGRPVEVVGLGISGARTGDVLEQQLPLLGDLEAFDVVVVVIGSNDVTHGASPWRFREVTRALLRSLPQPAVLGGIPLFTGVGAIPRPLRDVVVLQAGMLRRIQADVAAEVEGVRFVNIAREASPRFRGVPGAMSADEFHPAPVGYGFWADALTAGILDALGRPVES